LSLLFSPYSRSSRGWRERDRPSGAERSMQQTSKIRPSKRQGVSHARKEIHEKSLQHQKDGKQEGRKKERVEEIGREILWPQILAIGKQERRDRDERDEAGQAEERPQRQESDES
jgi:hypothetical protein